MAAGGIARCCIPSHGPAAGCAVMVACTAPVFGFFFALTGLSVIVLRRRDPQRERPFRVPLYPLAPMIFLRSFPFHVILVGCLCRRGFALGGGGRRRERAVPASRPPRSENQSTIPLTTNHNSMKRNPSQIVTPMLSSLVLLATTAFSDETKIQLDVPYVPTPQATVEMMLDMVDLKDGDVVWDLGCGDGRMVITAAKRNKIRGVGVDLDPKRIAESKANAEKAGVGDKVEFRVANLFETDFSDATVLTMYLLESVNQKLRPVILRDLEPGARIVSNTFTMGEWQADAKNVSKENGFDRTAYFWIVPANISGQWSWKMGDAVGTLEIAQRFQTFSGKLTLDGKEHAFEDGKIRGKEVSFVVDVPDREQRNYTAVVEGEEMKGKIGEEEWQATRQDGTAAVLDPVKSAN
jgi:precorrin-6B methylase 2